ncbi:MAG TPA: MBL fold metallo-hydrolase [Flavisolibacter sp.]|jgi:glyoxylase-like metal-dependent hydrolase (beta-lactamase superfamily II)|nr:MBL fold metallo-hydrolase [Flavisolibacter sp.]
MNRRIFLRSTGIISGATLLFHKKALASMFNSFDYNIKMLRNDVGIFTERGGTIGFLLSKDGIVVIDAQFPDTAQHLIDDLKKRNTNPFRYLLNTHHHGDHTAGNIAFKGVVEHVVAHENSLANQKAVAEKGNSIAKQLFPDMTFKDDWKLKIGDETIKADYYGAGHTNGDAIYHFEKANIFHAGDLMFNKRHPFVDRSAGANMTQWIKDLDKITKKANKNSIIIFGHSLNAGEETGTIEDVKKFQDYLGKVLAFAEQEIKKGVSKAEFIKNISIPGVTEWTGDGIQRPLAAAYEELTSKS